MARPQTDIEAGQKMILDIVEQLIRKRGAVEVTLQEIAREANMSQSNIYRFFENKEILWEAIAENWFSDKVKIMEDVTASDLPVEIKLYEFFARRFILMRESFIREPELFRSYCELGDQHYDVVIGYVDLGDHYLAMIISEAMDHGYFKGLTIDAAVSFVNLMVHPYVNPDALIQMNEKLPVEKLKTIISVILTGLTADTEVLINKNKADLHLVS